MEYEDELLVFGDFIKGTCELMCPVSERKMREREKLLHPLERQTQPVLPGEAVSERSHSSKGKIYLNRNENYRADPDKIVKAFSRSAAGHKMPSPSDLRPFPSLMKTVSYLIEKVASCEIEASAWVDRYNFVTDRLRAVRQDMVIQGLPAAECIKLLVPMVKFHVFAGYWLCGKPIHLYDPKINGSFLTECIKRLLVMYNAVKGMEHPGSKPKGENTSTQETEHCNNTEHLMNALYLIIGLGNPEVLNQASEKLLYLKDCKCCVMHLAFQISLASWRGNYVKVCSSMKTLTPLLCMAAALHLPSVRRHALMVMTTAYSNKVLKFPAALLQQHLLWEDRHQVYKECQHYGIPVDKSQNTEPSVHFQKGTFDLNAKQIQPSRLFWIDNHLSNSTVAEILLN
ncbi:SAC3 domain-containing protein 1 [Thrips palmi]|uniref:SAC3 domain-containing protein 1 n=1 Tax=Thrips palmi TaxID=161013 RepID=A0A6P8Z4B5_THRPL|nr:SAC3 domain-containing protein 1 [Thrips palmi]